MEVEFENIIAGYVVREKSISDQFSSDLNDRCLR